MTAAEFLTLRRRTGLSQARLARLIGVCVATVSRWERGVTAVPGPVGKLMERLAADATAPIATAVQAP